ncbi:MAG TPA: cupin domain-containing protein [Nannocystaceae bacterium]|nr:cupin domain-containing protein [Nannocystaceae bacterium]
MSTARVSIVRRDELPAITQAVVNGEVHPLGIVKDFRRHAGVADFLPAQLPTSFAWVHLGVGETLAPHVHPCASMIVVARGEGELLGDLVTALREGDVVMVPRGRMHGFRGGGAEGFWALSIQLEERGLYQDDADPRTTFARGTRGSDAAALAALLARNDDHAQRFAAHRIFALAKDHCFEQPALRQALLTRLQVWSDHFQRLLRVRAALSDDPALAETHLREELGHNEQLGASSSASRHWDPILSSTSTWFVWKTLVGSEPERAVLVHLVLEGAATVFYRSMRSWFATDAACAHFELHTHVDDHHVAMGIDALARHTALDLAQLTELQTRGWDVMIAMFDRIVESLELSGSRDAAAIAR